MIAVIAALSIVMRIVALSSRTLRMRLMMFGFYGRTSVLESVINKVTYCDWFILQTIQSNIDSTTFAGLIVELADWHKMRDKSV